MLAGKGLWKGGCSTRVLEEPKRGLVLWVWVWEPCMPEGAKAWVLVVAEEVVEWVWV